MFYEPADYPIELARIARGDSTETKARLSSRDSGSLKGEVAPNLQDRGSHKRFANYRRLRWPFCARTERY